MSACVGNTGRPERVRFLLVAYQLMIYSFMQMRVVDRDHI